MIFLTVGTQFPFDRLVQAIDAVFDDGVIEEKAFAQIGQTTYKPRNFAAVRSLDKDAFDGYVAEASAIISHAGIGIISMALAHKKPLLAMPRLKKYNEAVNDHQVSIARLFSELGHILVAYDIKDLPTGIRRLENFVPKERGVAPHTVVDRIRRFLDSLRN